MDCKVCGKARTPPPQLVLSDRAWNDWERKDINWENDICPSCADPCPCPYCVDEAMNIKGEQR